MQVINAVIERVNVEIEGEVYPVAEKTVAVAEELLRVRKECNGKPEYELWRADLEIMLGKDAVRKLFVSGKRENLDRMERIYVGVCRAFEYNHETATAESVNELADRLADALAPANELMRKLAILAKDAEKPR